MSLFEQFYAVGYLLQVSLRPLRTESFLHLESNMTFPPQKRFWIDSVCQYFLLEVICMLNCLTCFVNWDTHTLRWFNIAMEHLWNYVLYLFLVFPGWWFRSFFIFPYIGNFIIPTDQKIRGLGIPPISSYCFHGNQLIKLINYHPSTIQ